MTNTIEVERFEAHQIDTTSNDPDEPCEQFIKLRGMGYPDGSHEWGPLEVDVRHHAHQRKQRRRAFWLMLFVAAVTGVWAYGVFA